MVRRARRSRSRSTLVPLLLTLACGAEPLEMDGPIGDWPHWGGDLGGLKYSPLTQIRAANVDDLEIAWVHRSGDVSDGSGETTRTSFQTTPIVVDGTLYYCTGFNRVFALDPETGAQRWVFDPKLRARRLQGPYPLTCRGVSHWRDSRARPDAHCAARIFTGTIDSELIAIDAATGVACADFAANGRVALREGIADAPPWEYYVTSPPLVIRDVVVVGALVADNQRTDAPAGVVRGFDARTGALRWAWDPVPPGFSKASRDAEGRPFYQAGTPNVWSILSGDAQRGIVYVPTGNASPDAWSGERRGLDHYSSSVVALDSESGRVLWQFQTVHHDVWDYDVASQPALFRIPGVGGGVAGVAQATKMGHVFLLDRNDGRPLYPVEERPVPGGDVQGQVLSPTQPFPTHPPPLHPTKLSADDAWGFTPLDRRACAREMARYRSDGIFTPPSLEGSLIFPNNAGGINWGGISIDPERGLLFANQMHLAGVHWLVPRDAYEKLDPAAVTYPDELYPMKGTPYAYKRRALLSPLGAPCNPPPWGTLTAVDLRSGEVRWRSTLGTTRDQAPFPLWFDYGAPNLGGSIATAGGVVFVAATTDKFIRGFDVENGEEIWRHRLPYTGNSTPMTYRLGSDSRQYLVIGAGGHGWSEPGDAIVAFALP